MSFEVTNPSRRSSVVNCFLTSRPTKSTVDERFLALSFFLLAEDFFINIPLINKTIQTAKAVVTFF